MRKFPTSLLARLPAYRIICIIAVTLGAAFARAEVSKEHQIKAAFLYNFTKFVEWPAARFASADAPIVIGILGSNPIEPELEKIVRDRKVNGRDIVVMRLRTPADATTVHVLFVSEGEEKRFDTLGADLVHVLTVGESERFCDGAGMITFVTAHDRVRFEINVGAAEKHGLKISSQLQKLATVVRRTP